MVSCNSSKDVVYFQGSEYAEIINQNPYMSKIKRGDFLRIIVNSTVPELAQPFNMPLQQRTYVPGGTVSGGAGGSPVFFEVFQDGCINYPIFGRIQVDGLNRYQLQDTIESLIKTNDYIKDPKVLVSYKDRKFTVVGEVKSPGSYTFDKDRYTLFDALSQAGDLTIMGDRHNVKIVRERDGIINNTIVDLTNRNILSTPNLFIEANDIIYVEPIRSRADNRVISSLQTFGLSLTRIGVNIARYVRKL